MKISDFNLPTHFLRSGMIFASRSPVVVSTILGSCVSVTMYHRPTATGMICHALLPRAAGMRDYKYVDSALGAMVEKYALFGVAPGELEVKLFGGAKQTPGSRDGNGGLGIGWLNVEAATAQAALMGLRIAKADVGGGRGRKLFFFTHTGQVLLKRLNTGAVGEQGAALSAMGARN